MKTHSEPWEIHKEAIGIKDKNTKYIRVRGTQPGGKFHIADVRFFVCDDPEINKRNELEAYAIANLITSAPDLLEALEIAQQYVNVFLIRGEDPLIGEQIKGHSFKIIEAINKARGL